MSGAIGILRVAGPRVYLVSVAGTVAERLSYRAFVPCSHVLRPAVLGRQRSLTPIRSISTSPISLKRRFAIGSTKKAPRDASPLETEKRRKRVSKTDAAELPPHEGTSKPSLTPVGRPTYVTAPSISGKEMVKAIESSLQGSTMKATSASGSTLGNDPFANALDPFSNQLEKAIEAGSRARNVQRDRRGSSTSGETVFPDVHTQHLVGDAKWESVTAKEVEIKNITPSDRPKVATLEHGLDRVLFNPGVHWLQDSRSLVYNFDPYLRSICAPEDFDYNALPAYRTSSMDPALFNITHAHHGRYMGSTSSMTLALSQFYYLISGWKPLKTNHLSEAFTSQPKGFTRLSRAPAGIELVYKGNGIYAIDADKTFDTSTVLMQLGKSMEKMLTATPREFSRFTKAHSWQVTKEERERPEAFNYITVDNFVLRSQLDCEDPRLPGKTFDLKTRAAVAIRLDVHNYELNQGYQLRKAHGYLESFEREYYDMMRSAFLKYSLQVRIGQMDGIFVAFHNTARIFGFQYISLDEMDSRLFGTSTMGEECFRNQLRLLSRTLDGITAKYPEQDLKITLDTDETTQSMNVWVETMPLGAATSARGRDVKVVFDEDGAPEMQPGAELSLWQIVCFSNINKVPTVGPFELSEKGTDDWELRYKIGELKKPHMMSEYHQMRVTQAEILSHNEEEAVIAAAATTTASASASTPTAPKGSENNDQKKKSEIQTVSRATSRRDALRNTLRRISEQGKVKQEDEERRQADKEFLVWEPKGYTKIVESSETVNVVQPAQEDAVVSESIATRMVRRLKEYEFNPVASLRGSSYPEMAIGQIRLGPDGEIQEGPNVPSIYYRRAYDNKAFKLSLNDLSIIQKSLSSPLSNPTESARMEDLKETHDWLVKSLNRFDHVRFKMLEVPVREYDYNTMDREHLMRIARLMDQSEEVYAPDVTDETLRKKLHADTARFRCKLHLEYFHNWLHKVVALRDNAKPFRTMNDYLAVNDSRALIRAANGVNIFERMVRNIELAQGLDKPSAAKKALLNQVFYSEQFFSDEELKEMGFYPRIFDPAVIKNTRDILKGVGRKFRHEDHPSRSTVEDQDLSNKQAALSLPSSS
ncbi:hypothetical protein BGZ65_008278 [Modicella reniformis]|uniref:Pet127-domain-containing protein n=1 Tax=Modicella reniformis TaxID=1440133 RepID=A0A9P6INX6_9FUNG|nr:hypothetical protein BGZ65_008278 [Modicella reniformis]